MTSDNRFFKAIEEEFAQRFTSPRLRLPEEDFRERKKGKMPWGSGMVFYAFGEENGREYLEYFRYHHMGEGHARIYDDGTIVQLLTLTDDWFVYDPSLPGTADEQREAWDKEERKTIEEILAKGLYDDEWHP